MSTCVNTCGGEKPHEASVLIVINLVFSDRLSH